MKKLFISKAALAASMFFVSLNASALVVVEQIEQYSSPTNNYFQSVDFYSFSSTGGVATFDVYEMGFGGNNMDPMIWLFNDDGALDDTDLVAENDDGGTSATVTSDGTTHSYDSYLSLALSAGNYIFAIGECCNYGANDIVDGIQRGTPADLVGAMLTYTYDYQLTVTGAVNNFQLTNVNAVPAPSTIALMLLGGLGLSLGRKKKSA